MRSLRRVTVELAWPSLRDAKGGLLGVPFVLAGSSPAFVFGWRACLASLTIASLASFLVYIPVTALILHGGGALPTDAPAPTLTARAYGVLLALWSTTAWLGAAAAPHLH